MRTAPVTDALIADYLRGPAYTLGTYLAYTLHGTARHYSGGYLRRMQARIDARTDIIAVRSLHGGTAYRLA